ncbi:hypothetical protein [Streptomyces sp. NPDC058240]|uniref:hypothetical protein n=1 Tax=Streptomyces sp. NPDC058240 TaxID=3346396 RepID=UPI0036E2AFB5
MNRHWWALGALVATPVMFVMPGLMFILPGHLRAALGHDAFGTGVRMLPMTGGLIVAAHAVATKPGAQRPADSADAAYLHGMNVVLLVIPVAALVSALLVAAFLANLPTPSQERTDMAPAPVGA